MIDYWHGPPLSQEDLGECHREGAFLNMAVELLDEQISITARPGKRAVADEQALEEGGAEVKALWWLRVNVHSARLLAGALDAAIRLHELSERAQGAGTKGV